METYKQAASAKMKGDAEESKAWTKISNLLGSTSAGGYTAISPSWTSTSSGSTSYTADMVRT